MSTWRKLSIWSLCTGPEFDPWHALLCLHAWCNPRGLAWALKLTELNIVIFMCSVCSIFMPRAAAALFPTPFSWLGLDCFCSCLFSMWYIMSLTKSPCSPSPRISLTLRSTLHSTCYFQRNSKFIILTTGLPWFFFLLLLVLFFSHT